MKIDMQSPLFIAFFTSMVMLGLTVLNIFHAKKTNGINTLRKVLDSKVDKETCNKTHEAVQRFKTRIGEESDEHRESITKIEKGMIWVVQKMGGDPASMGLM